MSFAEPGSPYFMTDDNGQFITPQKDKPFPGARLTNKGNWRMFPCTQESPHEPWCHHFEWGPCSCGPEEGEQFVSKDEFIEALHADVVIPLESSSPEGSIPQAMEARRLYDERRAIMRAGTGPKVSRHIFRRAYNNAKALVDRLVGPSDGR